MRKAIEIVDAPEVLFHPRCNGETIEIVISINDAVYVKPVTVAHAASMVAQMTAFVAQMVAKG